MRSFKNFYAAAIVLGVLFAGPVHAFGFYGELLTSEQSVLLPTDIRAQLGVDIDFDPFDIELTQWNVQPDAGIGDGSLSSPVSYYHEFNLPTHVIDDAWLYVTLGGIGKAEVYLDQTFWAGTGVFIVGLATGESVEGFLQDDKLHVEVSGSRSVAVLNSLFKASVSPIPEPSAALVFGIGMIFAGTHVRRAR